MSTPKEGTEPEKGKPDWIELVTGRIGKISALVAALGGLLVLILNQFESVQKKAIGMKLYSPGACVEVRQVVFPKTVKFSEWDAMRIRLIGFNSCDKPLGLYVTFVRRTASEPRFILRVPHEELPECRGKAPLLEPKCWDPKKPVAIGKGDWEWETLPPPLSQLSDPRSIETIALTWEVRDYDEPTKPPIATDSVPIEVRYDTGKP
jgi:hypothetical protein